MVVPRRSVEAEHGPTHRSLLPPAGVPTGFLLTVGTESGHLDIYRTSHSPQMPCAPCKLQTKIPVFRYNALTFCQTSPDAPEHEKHAAYDGKESCPRRHPWLGTLLVSPPARLC